MKALKKKKKEKKITLHLIERVAGTSLIKTPQLPTTLETW